MEPGDNKAVFGSTFGPEFKEDNFKPVEGGPGVGAILGLLSGKIEDAELDISFGGRPSGVEANVPLEAEAASTPSPEVHGSTRL
ncbi:MAG TPA: hypothetical protein VH234_00445 [Candidatus Saccharimonadales bacterium]|jgi:hypothetical protein|nr:hypothetical protein [Candidatus Saccharimonadales bacterium]